MGPRWDKDGPRMWQDGAKIRQDGAKMGQHGAKMGPKWAKMGQDGATTKLVLKAPKITKLTKLVEKPSHAQSTVTRTGAGGFF